MPEKGVPILTAICGASKLPWRVQSHIHYHNHVRLDAALACVKTYQRSHWRRKWIVRHPPQIADPLCAHDRIRRLDHLYLFYLVHPKRVKNKWHLRHPRLRSKLLSLTFLVRSFVLEIYWGQLQVPSQLVWVILPWAMARKEIRVQLRRPHIRYLRLLLQHQTFFLHRQQRSPTYLLVWWNFGQLDTIRLKPGCSLQMETVHLQAKKFEWCDGRCSKRRWRDQGSPMLHLLRQHRKGKTTWMHTCVSLSMFKVVAPWESWMSYVQSTNRAR